MKLVAINVAVVLVLIPFVYWIGYLHGAFYQKTLDAPSKAMMISRTAELHETKDPLINTLLYTHLDTELSFYEEYINSGVPLIANMFHHSSFIEKDGEYLSRISAFIHSTNDGENKYKQQVAERLKRLGYGKP